MTEKAAEREIELTNRITEMVEGESVETLNEIHNLLNYYTGYKAGVYNGSVSVRTAIKIKPGERI